MPKFFNVELDKFGLAGAGVAGVTSFIGSMLQNIQSSAANKALESAYYTQSRLGLMSAATQNRYKNMELGDTVSEIVKQYGLLSGTQKASIAASNFDMSTGDKRILAQNERDKQETISAINDTAHYETEEMFKQAYFDYIDNQAKAKVARINAKGSSGWRGLTSALASASLSALGGYFQFANPAANLKG